MDPTTQLLVVSPEQRQPWAATLDALFLNLRSCAWPGFVASGDHVSSLILLKRLIAAKMSLVPYFVLALIKETHRVEAKLEEHDRLLC